MRYISSADSQKEDDLRFYREMRKSNECICERGKQPGMFFCYRCFSMLPADMQRALYGPLNQAVIEAYNEALKYLGD